MKTLLQSLAFIIFLTGCGTTISGFDQTAYSTVTSIKVDALNFMSLATDSYSAHTGEVKDFKTKLEKAYEYEKHRPKNDITKKSWDVLIDSNGHLLGGFIKRWADSTTLRNGYVISKKKEISEAFDILADLESKKSKKALNP